MERIESQKITLHSSVNVVPLGASDLDIAPVVVHIADRDHFVWHMDAPVRPLDMFPEVVEADIPDHRVDKMAPVEAGMPVDRNLAMTDMVAGSRAVVGVADSFHPSCPGFQTLLRGWLLIR